MCPNKYQKLSDAISHLSPIPNVTVKRFDDMGYAKAYQNYSITGHAKQYKGVINTRTDSAKTPQVLVGQKRNQWRVYHSQEEIRALNSKLNKLEK